MPDDAPSVEFTRFVSSVKGRLVARWDTSGSCFGARVLTREERKTAPESIVWDEACVVPLTAQFCAKYDRELRNAIRNGDLLERKREEWEAWLKAEEVREAERAEEAKALNAKVEDAKAEAAKAPNPPPETTPPDEAEAKPQGRKKNT
jgi:hypothetical protein